MTRGVWMSEGESSPKGTGNLPEEAAAVDCVAWLTSSRFLP